MLLLNKSIPFGNNFQKFSLNSVVLKPAYLEKIHQIQKKKLPQKIDAFVVRLLINF